MKKIKKHQQLGIYIEKNKSRSVIKEGIIGLKSLGYGQIQSNELESARMCIVRFTKRNCKLWVRVQMNIDHTKKSIGARMGKGVGSFDKSVCNLKKGTVIFEIFFSTIVSKHELLEALILSSKKLSIPVEIFQKSIKGI